MRTPKILFSSLFAIGLILTGCSNNVSNPGTTNSGAPQHHKEHKTNSNSNKNANKRQTANSNKNANQKQIKPNGTHQGKCKAPQGWKQIERAAQIIGTVKNVDIKNNKLISLTFHAEKFNTPAFYGSIRKGDTVKVFFEEKLKSGFIPKVGDQIVIIVAKVKTCTGKLEYASTLRTYLNVKHGHYFNLKGKEVKLPKYK